ncbi:MAG: DUF3727 domain-containing protein [Cyanobacteriota bacterium]
MPSDGPASTGTADVPTVLVRDSHGRQLLCFLEQLIPLEGHDYVLLTPVDTPVCLVKIAAEDSDDDDEVIDQLDADEEILANAEAVLQDLDLTLVRSAVTLTVSGDLEEPDIDELEEELEDDLEEDEDGETDLYELLIQFRADDQDYGLFIPLDPFFVVARMESGEAILVEDEEFRRIQPLIEKELDEREQGD